MLSSKLSGIFIVVVLAKIKERWYNETIGASVINNQDVLVSVGKALFKGVKVHIMSTIKPYHEPQN